MGNKRLKLAKGLGDIIPMSVNFSELQTQFEENDQEFDPSDNGLETKRMQEGVEYEELIVQILCALEPREKLVFVYQLLRDGGYKIDHASFGKTVGITRVQYMRVLETVRMKTALFVMGYQGKLRDERYKEK